MPSMALLSSTIPPWVHISAIALAFFTSLSLLRALYRGYAVRREFRRMKALGLPIIDHSWLWGHLPIFLQWIRQNPRDTHPFHIMKFIMDNQEKFFPGLKSVPPVLYLDIWPIDSPLMIVVDPTLSAQFTQDTSLPKHEMLKDVMMPLTKGEDLNTLNGEAWKTWRSRFNPGFSARNMLALLPEVLEEVALFGEILAKRAGHDNDWSDVFQLEHDTTNLTFDVIGRAILDLRLHEQTGKHSPLRTALIEQGRMLSIEVNPLRFLQPLNLRRRWTIYRNNQIMRHHFMSQIERRIEGTSVLKRKTVVDLALAALQSEGPETQPANIDNAFLDGLFQSLKIFLFAGHDTTATTICWIFHKTQQNPQILENLRAEHDAILGSDPTLVEETLRNQPVLLNALPYTTAVIKETLRLCPPSITIRQGHEGFSLTKAGFPPFPTDGFIIWDGVPAVHRNPDFWPKENDFIPERFLVGEDDPLYPPKNGWRPFLQPPRSCIGQELAMMEMKLALVVVARRFDIRTAWEEWDRLHPSSQDTIDGVRLYPVGKTTVHPKDGMPVQVKRRE